jgi:hypothetical protein
LRPSLLQAPRDLCRWHPSCFCGQATEDVMNGVQMNNVVSRHKRGIVAELVGAVVLAVGLVAGYGALQSALSTPPASPATPVAVALR